MRAIYISLLIVLFVCSCAGYRTTAFTTNSIHLGIHKEDVFKKFGKPFKTSFNTDTQNKVDTIYYKEVVDVSSYTYIMTSKLIFKDSILIKIEQKEDLMQTTPILQSKNP